VRGSQHNPVIEVTIDGPKLVTIEDCEVISRELHEAIESKGKISENFRLDVMSPGLEEPIIESWQFEKSLNRLVEIQYRDSGETHTVHGRLREFTAEHIAFEPILKAKKASKKMETAELPAAIEVKEDEQVYDESVALVMIVRSEIEKLVALPDFSRKA
jgi:ribosome maturation factor RimP